MPDNDAVHVVSCRLQSKEAAGPFASRLSTTSPRHARPLTAAA